MGRNEIERRVKRKREQESNINKWKEKYVGMKSERGKVKHEARRRARKESGKSETERNVERM